MRLNSSTPTGQPGQSHARLPYLPGLDGLRALAVVAVLLYHADVQVSGGFLGVESFFVLSGFLITGLLLAEWRANGRIDLTGFWLRRARRLLPALVFMLVGTVLLAGVLLPGESTGLGADLPAALAYVMNWHLIFSQQSYFDPMVRPPLLQHLWSLAIEEQFYLFWPVLFIIGMRYLRPNGLLRAVPAVAALSALLMAALYDPGADPSRVYYGTDTRAGGLLLGVALALVWTPGRAPASSSNAAGRPFDVAGIIALGGLVAAFLWLYDSHPLLYRGGFAVVAILTGVAIVAATHPHTRIVPGLLSWRPLRWIGVRSYGIYLWHWPIFMVTRPYQDVPLDGWPLLALRLALVVPIAAVSYHFIELPVRRGALTPVWQALRAKHTRAHLSRVSRVTHWRWLRAPIMTMFLVSSGACMSTGTAQTTHVPFVATTATTLSSSLEAAGTSVALELTPTPVATETIATSPTATASPAPPPTSTPVVPPTEVALPAFDAALAAELQSILDQTVADGYIPGAVLSVSIPGQAPWVGSSGIASRKDGQPMEPGTNVRIASISKIFTAVTVLQLAEEGTIDLDAPVATWLPGLLPNGDAITVRDLLHHTSGLFDYLEDRNFVNRAYGQLDHVWEPHELVDYAIQFPPSFEPGAEGAWDYSSTNYVLLGMIVEQATGAPLAEEMRRRIFEPLELEQTFFTPQEDIQGVLAHGYSNTIDQTDASMSFVFATASIVSTADDVRRFMQGLVEGRLLEPATLEMMYTFVHGKGQYNMPALEYGLGLMRNRLPVGPGPDGQPRPPTTTAVIGHIGGYGGFRAAVWHAPESGITIALGVNQAATDPNNLAVPVFDAILTHLGK